MRRRLLLTAATLLAAGAAFAQTVDGVSLGDERARLTDASRAAAAAKARAAGMEATAAAARSEADRTHAKIAAVEERIRADQAQVDAAGARLRILDALRRQQRAELAIHQQGLVKLAAALQMMARRPPALALAQPGSLDDLVHVRALLATTLPAVRARTAGIRAGIARVAALGIEMDRATAALRAGSYALDRQRLALVDLEGEQSARAGSLEGVAGDQAERALALGERARDIVDEMQEMGSAADTATRLAALPTPQPGPLSPEASMATGRGTPYLLPVKGPVAMGYGEVTDAGVAARGITFAAKADAKIVAPAPGRILYAGSFRSYGHILIIDHGGGWTTTVTGLGRLAVEIGDRVAQGDTLGRAPADRPRVTVELRQRGRPVDLSAMIGVG
ncbi:MAG: peptidoglycan DD-metalloendopeptidase family protein [Sphingomonadaceae bacterium]|nr:peptidoglycan DD-metalloendopeptidase family protein [Sphingomonadaceae bacterium]